jgi:hypothetical protein
MILHERKSWMKETRHQNKGYEIRNKRIRERSSDKADMQTMKNGQMY